MLQKVCVLLADGGNWCHVTVNLLPSSHHEPVAATTKYFSIFRMSNYDLERTRHKYSIKGHTLMDKVSVW